MRLFNVDLDKNGELWVKPTDEFNTFESEEKREFYKLLKEMMSQYYYDELAEEILKDRK